MAAKFHYRDAPSLGEKSSFQSYLSEDEELVLVTGLSAAYMRQECIIFFAFPGGIVGIAGAVLGWFLGIDKVWVAVMVGVLMIITTIFKTWHLYNANRYIFTTRRVMIKKGLFSVKLTAVLYDKITHIEVDQSFVDRALLHHGDIIINTAGSNKNEMILHYVDYPMELKNLLERLINREREHYGLRPSSVSSVEGEVIEEI